jgi:hypothetical protein
MKQGVERFWNNKVIIREVEDIEVYGKKFRIVLSTQIGNKKYKYLNCYEEKLNGLYYKSYQASEQGGSRALLSFSTIYVNSSNKENWFTVVYGHNKDLLVDNYEIKIDRFKENIVSSIRDKEYFINTYEGNFQDMISVLGKDGSDMFEAFLD